VRHELWPLLAAGLTLVVALLAEGLHVRRVRRVRALAFGPGGRPAGWVYAAPFLRAAALGALAWGLATLLLVEPTKHGVDGEEVRSQSDYRHIVLVLDVSPSMRLVDAGPEGEQSRTHRARELMESFFSRVPLETNRISVVAVYNGALPVVEDTTDFEVVRNILGDLPMEFAFRAGKTRLIDGIEQAVALARPWNPASTTLLVLSDGDTVPDTGLPRLPPSIDGVVVVGVGDPVSGMFIDGRQSRQDVSTLRQLAVRLGGTYWDGNERHLPSTLVGRVTARREEGPLERLTRREYALLACGAGGLVLAVLPMLLQLLGTRWRPGRSPSRVRAGRAAAAAVESLDVSRSLGGQ